MSNHLKIVLLAIILSFLSWNSAYSQRKLTFKEKVLQFIDFNFKNTKERENLKRELNENIEENEQLRTEKNNLKGAKERAEKERDELKGQNDTLVKNRTILLQEKEKCETKLQTLTGQLKDCKNDLEKCRDSVKALIDTIRIRNDSIAVYLQKIKECEESLQKCNDTVTGLRKKLFERTFKISGFQKQRKKIGVFFLGKRITAALPLNRYNEYLIKSKLLERIEIYFDIGDEKKRILYYELYVDGQEQSGKPIKRDDLIFIAEDKGKDDEQQGYKGIIDIKKIDKSKTKKGTYYIKIADSTTNEEFKLEDVSQPQHKFTID